MTMSITTQHELDDLSQQIAQLVARKEALLREQKKSWPKELTLYAYCSKDRNWAEGESLGLTGEALQFFVHFEEVRLHVQVAEHGAVTVLECDGHAVVPDARAWVPQIDSAPDVPSESEGASETNAQLLSAAPALLDVATFLLSIEGDLRRSICQCDEAYCAYCSWLDDAQQAVNKALMNG